MTLTAEGLFERYTVAVKSALLKIQSARPEAVIFMGMHQPCAEFIKLARLIKLDALIVTGSFSGGYQLARDTGPDGAGIIVTQVVPPPSDDTIPAVVHFKAALKAIRPSEEPDFTSFEAYLAGRLVIAALEKQQGEPDRRAFLATIFANSFDLDGIALKYGQNSNQGMNEVFLTRLQPDGTYRLINSIGANDSAW